MNTKKLHSSQKVFISDKNNEFIQLFKAFIGFYPYTPDGLRHRNTYHEQRHKARENFQAIVSANKSGEDINQAVLLQLLPHAPTANNSR
ncbi:MAG: ATPase, partial [Merismopedia sp. SIO2A8]|nr:ATPase [Merismopedia sp. SIO2A8]